AGKVAQVLILSLDSPACGVFQVDIVSHLIVEFSALPRGGKRTSRVEKVVATGILVALRYGRYFFQRGEVFYISVADTFVLVVGKLYVQFTVLRHVEIHERRVVEAIRTVVVVHGVFSVRRAGQAAVGDLFPEIATPVVQG